MSDPEQSSIERLSRSLYARTAERLGIRRRAPRGRVGEEIKESWGGGPDALQGSGVREELTLSLMRLTHRSSPLRVVFFFALAFFALSVGLSAYLLLRGTNVVSTQNIDIAIDGPVIVDGGKEAQFQITVTNNNTTQLELADLLVEYPQGTRSADNITQELLRHRESLGYINSGRSVSRTVRAVLFGEEGGEKEIVVTVEYRVPNSNAIFYKEKNFTLAIGSTPISLLVDSLEESTSGQELHFKVAVVSNATAPIERVLLRAEYPFGFTFKNASIKPSFGESVWELGDLPAGARKNIEITGVLEGQSDEERVFRFSVGVQSEKDERALGATFITVARPVVVKRPFIGARIAINGETAKQVAVRSNEPVRVDIAWDNALPIRIRDVAIEAKLSGIAFQRNSVTPSRGFYRSLDSTVLFNGQTDPALSLVEAGVSGVASFTFLTPAVTADLRNPEIVISVNIRANRAGEVGVPEEISSGAAAKAILASDLSVRAFALRSGGPFQNTGPFPPKAEQESTYTVMWSVTNSANAVSGIKVSAALPSYMRYVGVVSPNTEKLSFSGVGGIIAWDIGALPAGVGAVTPPRQVAFQVALTPSASQIGAAPALLGETVVVGEDRFTGTGVSGRAPALDTALREDPAFVTGQEIVQP